MRIARYVGVAVAALLIAGTGLTAIPDSIGYQGRLTNETGEPISGVITIKFSLFDADASGTSIWTETQDVAVAIRSPRNREFVNFNVNRHFQISLIFQCLDSTNPYFGNPAWSSQHI